MVDEVKRAAVIPAGTLFTASTGAYSDYKVSGVYRALADIDAEALLAAWLEKHPEQGVRYCFRENAFFADVLRQGLFEPLTAMEWHLGSYGDADEMAVDDHDAPEPQP